MRIAIFTVLCAVMIGEARADQFDLVCAGKYQVFDLSPEAIRQGGREPAVEERRYRISMDTDASLARVSLDSIEWGRVAKLSESPTRYEFNGAEGRWFFDRQSGRGGFSASSSAMSVMFHATCERADYTPIPERKF